MSGSLSPLQFDSTQRLAALRVKTTDYDQFVRNPLSTHTKDNPIPLSNGPRSYGHRVESLPVDRLESSQGFVSRRYVNNLARRKKPLDPIEVIHHEGDDRYEVLDGNHRTLAALKRGETHVPAVVHRS